MERELSLAADVQRAMLPERAPTVPGYSFWVAYEPALTVGGDFYDFATMPSGELLIVVADVAGKGIGAAMGMASLAGMMPLALPIAGRDLPRLAGMLNEGVVRWGGRTCRFASLVAAALDPMRHRLRVVNAGLSPDLAVVRRQRGSVERLCASEHAGFALGVAEGEYTELQVDLRPGDAVVLASDGIVNAPDVSGDEFGTRRFHEVLANTGTDPAELGRAALASAKAFAAGIRDDVVIVCFGRDA